jgi:hypothetical protein
MSNIKKILFIVLLFVLIGSTPVYAETTRNSMRMVFDAVFATGPIKYEPITNIPGVTDVHQNGQPANQNPAEIFTSLYKFAIGIATILAVIMIMWGGFEYMTTEAFTGKNSAKDRITYSFVGLILLLGSYIILNTINRNLLTFKITFPTAGETGMNTAVTASQDALNKFEEDRETALNTLAKVNGAKRLLEETEKDLSDVNAQMAPLEERIKMGKELSKTETELLENLTTRKEELLKQQTEDQSLYAQNTEGLKKQLDNQFTTALDRGLTDSAKNIMAIQKNQTVVLEEYITRVKPALQSQKTQLEAKIAQVGESNPEAQGLKNQLAVVNEKLAAVTKNEDVISSQKLDAYKQEAEVAILETKNVQWWQSIKNTVYDAEQSKERINENTTYKALETPYPADFKNTVNEKLEDALTDFNEKRINDKIKNAEGKYKVSLNSPEFKEVRGKIIEGSRAAFTKVQLTIENRKDVKIQEDNSILQATMVENPDGTVDIK